MNNTEGEVQNIARIIRVSAERAANQVPFLALPRMDQRRGAHLGGENGEHYQPCFLLWNDHVWMLSHLKESLRTMMNELIIRADTLGFAAKH